MKMAEEKQRFTKYELARIIGARALQISMGAPLLIQLKKEELEEMGYSPVEMAKREFREGIVPITVRRLADIQSESK